MKTIKTLTVSLSLLTLLTLSACQKPSKNSLKSSDSISSSSSINQDSSKTNKSSSDQNTTVDENSIEDSTVTIDLTPIDLPDMTGVDYAHPSDEAKAILNPYKNLYQYLNNFKDFVNKRSDLKDNEKAQIIAKRARYIQINDQLKERFSKFLSSDEMKKYETLIVPSYSNGGPGETNEEDDEKVKEKIKNVEAENADLLELQKKLNVVESGNLLAFEEKVQKEGSKLLGF